MAKRQRKPESPGPIPEDVLDRLHGGPPEEFVANRNAAAKELTKAGDRAGAEAVRALRRPSAPAAAINRAVRAEPDQTRALLDAGRDLRHAHEAVLSGDADRDALKAATNAERQAVNAFAASAAAAMGGRVSDDVERRIRDTLQAVALDQEVRERFEAGRLDQDARAAGLATGMSAKAGRTQPKSRAKDQARRKADQRERRKLEDAVRRAKETLEGRRRDVAAAERARTRADATLRDSRKRVKQAEAELRSASRAAQKR